MSDFPKLATVKRCRPFCRIYRAWVCEYGDKRNRAVEVLTEEEERKAVIEAAEWSGIPEEQVVVDAQ